MPAPPAPKWVCTRNKHHVLDLGALVVVINRRYKNAWVVKLNDREQDGVHSGVEDAMDAGVRAAYAFANEIKHALDRYRMGNE